MPSLTTPETPRPRGPHATGHHDDDPRPHVAPTAPTPPAPRPHVATIEVSRRALVELHAHASTAAYIFGHIDEGPVSPAIERLAVHIDAMAHGIGGLLQGAPIAHAPAAPVDDAAPADVPTTDAPTPDALAADASADDATTALPLDRWRLALARADALASVTDEHYSRLATDDVRGRSRLAHLVELVALAVFDVVEISEALISTIESLPKTTTRRTTAPDSAGAEP
jgi:hypothetical protein